MKRINRYKLFTREWRKTPFNRIRYAYMTTGSRSEIRNNSIHLTERISQLRELMQSAGHARIMRVTLLGVPN